MSEPTSAVLAGQTAGAVGMLAAIGQATGLDFGLLLWGLFGGAIALSRRGDPVGVSSRVMALATAAICAGAFTPTFTHMLAPWASKIGDAVVYDGLRWPVALSVGFVANKFLIPLLEWGGNWFTKRVRREGDRG